MGSAHFSLTVQMGLNTGRYQGTNTYTVLSFLPNTSPRCRSLMSPSRLDAQTVQLLRHTYKSCSNERRKKNPPFKAQVAKWDPFLLKAGCDDLPAFGCFQSYKIKLALTRIDKDNRSMAPAADSSLDPLLLTRRSFVFFYRLSAFIFCKQESHINK